MSIMDFTRQAPGEVEEAGMAIDQGRIVATEGELQAAIYRLLNEGKTPGERRDCRREPFFREFTLIRFEGGEERRYPCLSRDLSPTGIGLLHAMPLEVGDAVLAVFDHEHDPVLLRGRVMWCQPYGAGRYLSAAEFTLAEPPLSSHPALRENRPSRAQRAERRCDKNFSAPGRT